MVHCESCEWARLILSNFGFFLMCLFYFRQHISPTSSRCTLPAMLPLSSLLYQLFLSSPSSGNAHWKKARLFKLNDWHCINREYMYPKDSIEIFKKSDLQKVSLHQELHPHKPVLFLHPESERCLYQRYRPFFWWKPGPLLHVYGECVVLQLHQRLHMPVKDLHHFTLENQL